MNESVKELVNIFFEKLNVQFDNIEVEQVDESNIFNIKIQTQDS
jgi:hypothetical protein